jgi:AAA domain
MNRHDPFPAEEARYRSATSADGNWQENGESGLPFVVFDSIAVDINKPWILKNVLAQGETSSWVGGPGKGKSALLTDLAVHIVSGWDWRGYRLKMRCAVVFLAFERADLLVRRLEAYKRKYKLEALPIAIVKVPVNLMDPASVRLLTDTIDNVMCRLNSGVGLLIVDTFAKAIAYGGGDENSAKDQNRVLGHLRQVQNETDVHVALVGHTGKDEARGARGSNAHLGDVDLMVQFTGDLVKSAVITKANDRAEGPLTTFQLETFDFGNDKDGDPITTSVVSADVPDQKPRAQPKRALSDRQKIALDSLVEVLITSGVEAPTGLQLPKSIRVVDTGKWRDEMFRRGALDKDAPNPRADFIRVRDALVTRRLIGFRDDLAWKVD